MIIGANQERLGRHLVIASQVVITLTLVVTAVVAGRHLPMSSCAELRRNMDHWGLMAPAIYVVLYAWSSLGLLPGLLLTVAAGVVFGVGEGFVWSMIGSVSGATLAFACGRFVAGDLVRKMWGERLWFRAFAQHAARDGFVWLLSARLSPVVPFTMLNYAAGAVPIKASHYLAATTLGMIPGKLVFLFAGSTVGCALLDRDGVDGSLWSELLWPLGLLTLASLVPLAVRYSRRVNNEP